MTELSTARTSGPLFARGRREVIALLAALACAYFVIVEWLVTGGCVGLPLDDSWIHLDFARSLAYGQGLAFNPGELMPASTAPLWTALVSLLFHLPFEPRLLVKLAGVVLAGLGVVETAHLARALGLRERLSLLAAAATALTDSLAWAALSGMEIPLFVLLTLAGLRLHVEEIAARRAGRLSLLLFALACLARPEGLLLLGLSLAERRFAPPGGAGRAIQGRRLASLARDLALVLCVLLPVAFFAVVVSGSPLPTTFAAKTQGAPRFLPDLHAIYLAFGLFFRSHPILALLAGGGALELVRRRFSGRRTALLPALWLFALPTALALLRGESGAVLGNFGRYLFPLFPVLAVVGCAALSAPLAAIERREGSGRRVVRVAAMALLLAPPLFVMVRGGGRYAQNVANVEASDLRLARWLSERLPPEALLAVADIGAMRFVLPNRLLDLGALVSPELRREVRREVAERGADPQRAVLAFLEASGADFVVAFPRTHPGLDRDPARFTALLRVPIPDNITMAGDELVLYRTAWCRHPLREPAAGPDPTRRTTP